MKISIIIPCRNEEKFIGRCLDSVIAQDYPKDETEVLVLDGMSTDKTREVISEYNKKYTFIKMLDNEKKIVPTAMNIGIKSASGEIIVRLDAHNTYPVDYVSKCVKYLIEYKVDNVGGRWVTLPGDRTKIAKAIAITLSSRFGVGDARYRTGVKEPTYVDTVPFGCFNKTIFDKLGYFDEDLVRGQDGEFNLRIIKNGGKILLAPDIVSYYYARSTFGKLSKMYAQYGYFKALTVMKLGKVLTLRQIIPALFIISLIVLFLGAFLNKVFLWLFLVEAGLYLLLDAAVSAKLALKNGILLFPLLIYTFALIHFSFGFNYLRGVIDFWILKKHRHRKISDLPLSR